MITNKDIFCFSFQFNVTPDSGASKTLISNDLVEYYQLEYDSTRTVLCTDASHNRMSILGTIELSITFMESSIDLEALVAEDMRDEILLSWPCSVQLGMLTFAPGAIHNGKMPSRVYATSAMEDSLEQIKEDFKNILTDDLPPKPVIGQPIQIQLRKDIPIKPVKVTRTSPPPLHMRAEAEKTIKLALEEGVIEQVPIDEPSEWLHRGFFVPKPNGKLRLVVDMSELNKYVLRPVHCFPSTADLLKSIDPKAKYFCRLDMLHAYHQLPLSKESSALTTFLVSSGCHKGTGRLRYLRCPMGLNASSDFWGHFSDAVLQDLGLWCTKLIDDVLIAAETYPTLLKRLRMVLHRCSKANLAVSLRKIIIGQEVSFGGYLISHQGIKPDPKAVEAVQKYPIPTDVGQLRSFAGFVNQLCIFRPDLSQLLHPLHQLLRKNTAFIWLMEHQEAFDKIKEVLTSDMFVRHFDASLPTTVVSDASRIGLGHLVMQEDQEDSQRVIACGSRSLTAAEANYAVNELETLGIVFAITKNRHYLLGCPSFTVITDHRPLVGTFAKNLADVENPRIRRLREKVLQYSFTVKWVAGRANILADALSRAPISGSDDQEDFRDTCPDL